MEHDTFAHLIEVKQNWQFACCESSFCFHAQVNALWFIYWKKINTISTNKRLNWEARESRWGKGCAEESLWVLYREVPQKLGGFSVLFQPGGVHSHAEEDLKDMSQILVPEDMAWVWHGYWAARLWVFALYRGMQSTWCCRW